MNRSKSCLPFISALNFGKRAIKVGKKNPLILGKDIDQSIDQRTVIERIHKEKINGYIKLKTRVKITDWGLWITPQSEIAEKNMKI